MPSRSLKDWCIRVLQRFTVHIQAVTLFGRAISQLFSQSFELHSIKSC